MEHQSAVALAVAVSFTEAQLDWVSVFVARSSADRLWIFFTLYNDLRNERSPDILITRIAAVRIPKPVQHAPQRGAGIFAAQWLERETADQKDCDSNPTSAPRLSLSRLGHPDSIPTLLFPSGGLVFTHRKAAAARCSFLSKEYRMAQIILLAA
ncbi:hypothetical protein CSKR_113042 [Clonorchis sinensis]|uniref:Uncharacterized protein n=1 Tax=Clonorchis sinensis TaxID=79923 RepID=A0A419QFE3_CLOSI|nr:hypothetical protein CSKR_113042 [Clonorchis sinensis]